MEPPWLALKELRGNPRNVTAMVWHGGQTHKVQPHSESFETPSSPARGGATRPGAQGTLTLRPFPDLGSQALLHGGRDDNLFTPPPSTAISAHKGAADELVLVAGVRETVSTSGISCGSCRRAGTQSKSVTARKPRTMASPPRATTSRSRPESSDPQPADIGGVARAPSRMRLPGMNRSYRSAATLPR